MNVGADLRSRIARALAAHAVSVADPEHAEWTTAMLHEQEHLPLDASALSWALGCVFVSYRTRLRSIIKVPDPPRSRAVLLMILLVCLASSCVNFIHVAASMAQGDPLFFGVGLHYTAMQEALIFGSATLIGPIGLAAALWVLLSPANRLGTIFMVILWTLTVWATVYVAIPARSAEWRAIATPIEIFSLLLNFVLLPALGVGLLQRLDARRRR